MGTKEHGEGNYKATQDYNARTKDFIESGKVDKAARDAKADNEQEAKAMAAAEEKGKARAVGTDPNGTGERADN